MRAYLGLGANLGDRAASLALARRRLAEAGVTVSGASAVEETAPVGVTDQPDFLNQVIEVETELEPVALLRLCKAIEAEAGRRPGAPRWGPRELDFDILLFGDLVINQPGLKVPHPELRNREFVLRELREIAPDAVVPV